VQRHAHGAVYNVRIIYFFPGNQFSAVSFWVGPFCDSPEFRAALIKKKWNGFIEIHFDDPLADIL
jgi:hypothetical protein